MVDETPFFLSICQSFYSATIAVLLLYTSGPASQFEVFTGWFRSFKYFTSIFCCVLAISFMQVDNVSLGTGVMLRILFITLVHVTLEKHNYHYGYWIDLALRIFHSSSLFCLIFVSHYASGDSPLAYYQVLLCKLMHVICCHFIFGIKNLLSLHSDVADCLG